MKVQAPLSKPIPLLRGKIHLPLLFFFSFILFLALKYKCNLSFRLAYYVFIFCSFFNFLATLILHNRFWTQVSRSLIRRIDYAGIFLMIGGTGFPFAVHHMNKDVDVWFVLVHWSVIFFGVFGSLLFNFTSTPKWFRSSIYVLLAMPYFYYLYLGVVNRLYVVVALILFTFFFYTLGSVFYAVQYPNLVPGIFESHELFHLFCMFGFLASSSVNIMYWNQNKL